MKFFSTTFFLFIISVSIYAQKQYFDIILFGDKIGTMSIERTQGQNGFVFYKLESKSEATVMFTHRKSELLFDVIYKDGKLHSSYSKNTVNDKVETYASANWDGNQYIVQNESKKFNVSKQVSYSVVSLFFKEPQGLKTIFSERIGDYVDLTETSPNEYEFKMPNGDRNIYRFENGKVKEVEMKRSVGSAYMRPSA